MEFLKFFEIIIFLNFLNFFDFFLKKLNFNFFGNFWNFRKFWKIKKMGPFLIFKCAENARIIRGKYALRWRVFSAHSPRILRAFSAHSPRARKMRGKYAENAREYAWFPPGHLKECWYVAQIYAEIADVGFVGMPI